MGTEDTGERSGTPLVIPYAADRVAESQVLYADDDEAQVVGYNLPSVSVAPGAALRLNSGQLAFGEPPPIHELSEVPEQLAFLSRHFQHQCGLWSKPARAFIAGYFAFIAQELDRYKNELIERTAPFGDLYVPAHWVFSALRPLPRAHLPAPEQDGDQPPESLVAVDIAFWSASGAIAIHLAGGASPGRDQVDRRDRLVAAGVEVVEVASTFLEGQGADMLADTLPDPFHTFWRDEALPSGPFKTEFDPV